MDSRLGKTAHPGLQQGHLPKPAPLSHPSGRAVLAAGVGFWARGQGKTSPDPLLSAPVSPTADKYCPLLIKEGGMPLLRDMIKMATARQETKEMAR